MPDSTPHRSLLCESPSEELANCLTHALGLLLSMAAWGVMAWQTASHPLKLLAAVVFGASLVLLYGASTCYHLVTSPRWKERLQRLDHMGIYILIAGSYTPVTLIALRGPWGWSLLAVVWGMALAGVLIKGLVNGRKDHWLSTALYLLMGWLILPAWGPLWHALSAGGVAWLAAGGIAYSAGIAFFVWDRLPFHHAIWHLFVLLGSACHVMAVSRFVF